MTTSNAILFDLDGTLLDTANDIARALNNLLEQYGRPPLPLDIIRPIAGYGSNALLRLGGLDERLGEQLFAEYQKHLLDSTALFPGIQEVLIHLEKEQIPWGIVTNKPKKFTQQIIDKLQFAKNAKCIISGDSLKNAKPHPEPILHACRLLEKNPENCIYIGDAKTDMQASNAAGTTSLVALYGYIPPNENPKLWQAHGYIGHPREIVSWIKK